MAKRFRPFGDGEFIKAAAMSEKIKGFYYTFYG